MNYAVGRKVFDAVAASGTNTYKSEWTDIRGMNEVSFHVVTTGTLTGALTVEVSNSTDEELAAGTGLTPVVYDLISPPAISGAMNFGLTLSPRGWGKVRLSYTNATNSGTITAQRGAKEGG